MIKPWDELRFFLILALTVVVFVVTGCEGQNEPQSPSVLVVPNGFPQPRIPADNPLSAEKIALGRRLFYDPALSRDFSVSCATCHDQARAFTDGLPTARGVGRELGPRNSPTITNAAFRDVFFFDGRTAVMEEQVKQALYNPAEMYNTPASIRERMMSDESYRRAFEVAFGSNEEVSDELVAKAIASFVRTIVSAGSRYDRFKAGDSGVLTASERRGHDLFFSSRTKCGECHGGFDLTDFTFHSTGLYTHYYDKGRFEVTRQVSDVGRFKSPSLRNIALSAPYMHDGSVATLEEVMDHYNRGGKPFLNKDSRIVPLGLTSEEVRDLIAFMQSFTDSSLILNRAFSRP